MAAIKTKGPIHALYIAWLAADDEYQRQLVLNFGKRAGDMRYADRTNWPEALIGAAQAHLAAGNAYRRALQDSKR
jgi:hypothetical protein